ncbi:MAG TPA: DegV family protein [Candidatus Scatavimonas merdigallinarum]|mgnify:FL=1|uniref:DegV family protein n=1 Tax=Candidatus Scatavimonas merdigallinarum TaxID=2840914 RepID=A0A9D1CUE3_9FIRM|nr:DegV family protein [Candidatus Scatavimonas merdigallinarum]
MNDYVIVTDANTDLTPQMVEELEIAVMPMQFSILGKNYLLYPDNREMDIKEFYDLIRKGNMAATAQLNPNDIIQAFTPYLEEGKDLIYIAFSSGLSGTYASACMAKDELCRLFPQRKIVIVDSLAASMGEGLLVWHAVGQKRAGLDIEQLAQWVLDNRNHLCHWFTVDDLHHLKRGGRVSSATAVIGSALGIKPVLHVDDQGHLIPIKKVRGRKQSLDALVDMMRQTAFDPKEQTVFISHGDALDDARYVEKRVRDTFKCRDIHINYIGPVIGTHSGPGTVALFFMGTHK